MTFLTATDQSLKVTTSTAANIAWQTAFVDHTTSASPGTDAGLIVAATTTTIVASPAATTTRQLLHATLTNIGTAANTLQVLKGHGGSDRRMLVVVLAAGETLCWTQSVGWYVLDSAGRTKMAAARLAAGAGQATLIWKAGTGADTIGYHYCHAKDAGFPGAWGPGAPGLAGRATDGTLSADAGCIPLRNPSAGATNLLRQASLSATVAHYFHLWDVLWCNSGVVVTTTTAQTINSVALPARDAVGTANGEGVMIGLLFTAASTAAAVINNSTVSYTNSNGVSGRTATLANLVGAQIPATPVVGTIVWFLLQAGDTGARSIQSLTLGTSLVAGSVSLVLARRVWGGGVTLANAGTPPVSLPDDGVPLFNGTCMLCCYTASAVTATTTTGDLVVIER
jgi:hypothetical protein